MLFEYEAQLPEPCAMTEGWLSIAGKGDPDCRFFWVSSHDGDDWSYCVGCDGPWLPVDLNFCLLGVAGDVSGACCDEAPLALSLGKPASPEDVDAKVYRDTAWPADRRNGVGPGSGI